MNVHPTSTEMGRGRGTAPFPCTPSPTTKLGRLHKSLDTPGLIPGFGVGQGLSGLIWMVAFVAVALLVWRGRKNQLPGTAIVLKKFAVHEEPGAKVAVEIVGRASGIVSWVLNLLRLEPEVELTITDTEASIRTASLSGVSHTYVPLSKISATFCAYQRSIFAFGLAVLFAVGFILNLFSGFFENNRNEVGSDMGLAFGFLILAGVATLVYFLSKRIAVVVETTKSHGVLFKRSVIENVTVDLPEALRVIAVINARVLASWPGGAPTGSLSLLPSAPEVAAVPSAGKKSGRCSRCAAVNPIDVRFCENCGAPLPA